MGPMIRETKLVQMKSYNLLKMVLVDNTLNNHLHTPDTISMADNVVKLSTLLLLDLSAVLVARTWT